MITLRKEILRLSHACGVHHPGFLSADHMEILDGSFGSRPLHEVFKYELGWEIPSVQDRADVMRELGIEGVPGAE